MLFFGVRKDGHILGYAAASQSALAREVAAVFPALEAIGVFSEIPFEGEHDSRTMLLAKLTEIYHRRWIPSKRIGKGGQVYPYKARNAGGYTLEAELGISPNSYAEPDYLGWEIKQYGVSDFVKFRARSPVTLMTPEPSGGVYHDAGVEKFLNDFGYADVQGRPDRINFGGIYRAGSGFNRNTGLKMELGGLEEKTGKILDMEDGIRLVSRGGKVAALWRWNGLMEHWTRKHAQAAYVPSLHRTPPPEYCYGPRVILGEGTDFRLFLEALGKGLVYYDPAVKMEEASSVCPKIKRRSQFRIKHADLATLYFNSEEVPLEY